MAASNGPATTPLKSTSCWRAASAAARAVDAPRPAHNHVRGLGEPARRGRETIAAGYLWVVTADPWSAVQGRTYSVGSMKHRGCIGAAPRSEEHTSELQSPVHLV